MDMSDRERLEHIYKILCDISPYVRRSMLHYDMIHSTERTLDDLGRQIVRDVEWMSVTHLYVPIIEHNAYNGQFGNACYIHRYTLAGMPMVGVYKEFVVLVADLVWQCFCQDPESFPLYSEDGAPFKGHYPRPIEHNDDDDDDDGNDDDTQTFDKEGDNRLPFAIPLDDDSESSTSFSGGGGTLVTATDPPLANGTCIARKRVTAAAIPDSAPPPVSEAAVIVVVEESHARTQSIPHKTGAKTD